MRGIQYVEGENLDQSQKSEGADSSSEVSDTKFVLVSAHKSRGARTTSYSAKRQVAELQERGAKYVGSTSAPH